MSAVEHRWPWLVGFRPLPGQARSSDPLEFPGYGDQLARAAGRSGADESVTCGLATVEGHEVVAAAFSFEFLGGSMGEATGRRLVEAIEVSTRRRVPLVSLVASGGARMQEGMLSLVQMQAVAAALLGLSRAGVPHLAVLRHPTTGGVWASLASAADVVLAERRASVAFAGARVRGHDSDAEPFRAEGKLAAGAVDALFDPADVGREVARYVRGLSAALASSGSRCDPPRALPGALGAGSGWEAVLRARSNSRPRARAYLDHYFDERLELSGDRCGGRDPAILCGIGLRAGEAVAYIAQTGEANTAAGFRTTTRMLGLAERWGIPVLTLIDTPGAANDDRAEREGVGTAIAQTLAAIAATTVPITSLLIGEGGSGGALALAAPGHLWAVPASYFSVIAPEGAAAILHRDPARAAEVADALRVGPDELVDLGILRGVVDATGVGEVVA